MKLDGLFREGSGWQGQQGNERMWQKKRLERRFEARSWRAPNAVLRSTGLILKMEKNY